MGSAVTSALGDVVAFPHHVVRTVLAVRALHAPQLSAPYSSRRLCSRSQYTAASHVVRQRLWMKWWLQLRGCVSQAKAECIEPSSLAELGFSSHVFRHFLMIPR
jgi:hypothetical protein